MAEQQFLDRLLWFRLRAPTSYAVGIAALLPATLGHLWLSPITEAAPFLFFHAALPLVSWYCGLFPGIVCTGLATAMVANLFFKPPYNSILPGGATLAPCVFFFALHVAFAALAQAVHRYRTALQSAVQIRDEFLSIAGHELRTPLTSLRLRLHSLGRVAESASAHLKAQLERAVRSAERLTALVNELLDASRLTTGKLQLNLETVELVGLLQGALQRLEREMAASGCKVQLSAPPALEGHWDRLRIEQVVANLVENAIKFGASKPIIVEVSSRGERALLSVTDQGQGISASELRRIFERFKPAGSQGPPGMGVGLWLSRQLVEAHGGELRARSSPGKGSTFSVELPLRPHLRPEGAVPPSPIPATVSARPARLQAIPSFLVIGLLLLLPFIFVSALQYRSATSAIEFNQKEHYGVAYIRPAFRFLISVEKHRIARRALEERPLWTERMRAIEAEAAGELAQLRQAQSQLGHVFNVTHKLDNMEGTWELLVNTTPTVLGQLETDYEKLVKLIHTFILSDIGNASNLILDPDLNSYWLMDALVMKFPPLVDAVGRGTALILSSHRALEERERIELASLYTYVRATANALESVNLYHASQDDERRFSNTLLAQRLSEPLARLQHFLRANSELFRSRYLAHGEISNAASLDPSAAEVLASFDAADTFYRSASDELERILRIRIQGHEANRTKGLVATATTAVLLMYLFVAFFASVRRSFRALEEANAKNASLVEEIQSRHDALQSEKELRERFVSILAHDLRGPLSAAKVNASFLQKKPDWPVAGRELAQKIVSAIDRTDQMVKDLLDANRIRAGQKLSLELTELDLAAMTSEVAQELALIHGDRFQVDGEPNLPCSLSAQHVRRAIWNLATNAAKYGTPGSPIRLTVAKQSGVALVSVHNQGNPLSPEDQSRLFQPYVRTEASRTHGPYGWGLGLTLVRGCAEAHGGRVLLHSDEASGTTFTLEFPLSDLNRRSPDLMSRVQQSPV
jgi:signal transduction histidine kinase